MNKFKIAIVSLVGVMSLGSGVGVVSAQTANPCDGNTGVTIVNTGPGSNNQVVCSNTSTVVFTCTNGVIVNNVNSQTGTTGAASATGNTSAGNVGSGPALNEGETSTDANATCLAAAPTPTPTPTPTPGTGNEGPTPTPRPPVITGLPDTASNSTAETAGAVVTGSLVLALVAALAVRAYRHRAAH